MANGLLDFLQTPAGTGLLSAVAGGLAGARRGTPLNNIGRGGLAGLTGYAQAQDDILRKQQLDEVQKMNALQRQQLERTIGQQAKEDQFYSENLGKFFKNATPETSQFVNPLPPMLGADPNQAPLPASAFETKTIPGQPASYDQMGLAQAMLQSGVPGIAKQGIPLMKPREPIKVGKDDRLLDSATYKELIGAAPEKIDYNKPFLPDGTPNKSYQDYSMANRRAGAPSTQLIMPTQEKEQSKEYGKSMGELRGQINKSGFEGPSKLAQLQRMEQLLAGVDGGNLAPLGKDIASGAASFGVKIDPKLGNKEAAESLTRELASALRKPGTGPMTDKDYDNFLMQVPSLSKTPEGRKQITMTLRGAIKRDMEAAKFARSYAKKNGGVIDDNFFDELADFYAKNPVITSTQAQPTLSDIQAEIMRRQGKK